MSIFKKYLNRLLGRKQPEKLFQVAIDAIGVKVEHPRRPAEAITWEAIRQILIITNNSGPWQTDVWLALAGKGEGCLIPLGAEGFEEVLEIIAQFENFDFEIYLQAMASTSNQKFLLWERR